MRADRDFRPFGYFIIALGGLLNFASAVVPFYGAGYRLFASVLFIGLMPYIVYGFFTDVVRGWPLLVAGALIFGIDIGVKIPERFLHYDGYTGGGVYDASLISTAVALVILGIGARRERRRCGEIIPVPGLPATVAIAENDKP